MKLEPKTLDSLEEDEDELIKLYACPDQIDTNFFIHSLYQLFIICKHLLLCVYLVRFLTCFTTIGACFLRLYLFQLLFVQLSIFKATNQEICDHVLFFKLPGYHSIKA